MNGAGLTTMKLLVSKAKVQLCVVPSGAEAVVGAGEEGEEEEVLALTSIISMVTGNLMALMAHVRRNTPVISPITLTTSAAQNSTVLTKSCSKTISSDR